MYPSKKSYTNPQYKMSLLPNFYYGIYKIIKPYIGKRILELGCGSGHILNMYYSKNVDINVVDIESKILKKVKKKFPSVKTFNANLENKLSFLKDNHYDTVILLDVLEHIKDDLGLIEQIYKKLKKNGLLILKVPANKKIYSSIDKSSGHFRRYDKCDLKEIATGKFDVKKIKKFNIVGYPIYLLKSLNNKDVNFSETFPDKFLKITNILLPLIQFFDKLKFLPSLSYITILKKI